MPTQRQAQAQALRLDGATFRTIGGILGVSTQRAAQLVQGREARRRQREQRQRQRQRRAEQQRALVAELHDILIAGGAITVSDWADLLNLPRSTAHSVFATPRKNGITRATVKRMLASPQLPSQARARLTSWQIPASTSEKPLAPMKPAFDESRINNLMRGRCTPPPSPGHPPETLSGWGMSETFQQSQRS
jgi:hypothetical protein